MAKISKEFLKRVFTRDRIVSISAIVAVILHFITWILLIWRGLPLANRGFLPLHYNIYFGVDLIGPWYELFIPVLFGLGALIINFFLITLIYERRRLFAHFFSLGTVLLELIILTASFFMILLNL